MALTLAQQQAITQLADLFYEFLPGTPHPFGDPSISFQGVAADLSLPWHGGSKRPAIASLLRNTFEGAPKRFAPLILEVIRRALVYRGKGSPLGRDEIDQVNSLLLAVSLKIPELHDPAFLNGLSRPAASPKPPASAPPEHRVDPARLKLLAASLTTVTSLEPRKRGLAFEGFLNDLFEVQRLAPRNSFRLVGEQIDGSFEHAGQTYLVEAKWQADPVPQADLLVLSGKVGGKAAWSRGVFMSVSGYSADGLQAFSSGRQTNIVCFDGLDLYNVLAGTMSFTKLLDLKLRRAAESNRAFVSVRDLAPTAL